MYFEIRRYVKKTKNEIELKNLANKTAGVTAEAR